MCDRKEKVLKLVDNLDAAVDWIVLLQGDIAELKELNSELLAACEAIAEMKRYIFIDTPLIEVVEKLQQQIADMKTTAAAAIAKAKPPTQEV